MASDDVEAECGPETPLGPTTRQSVLDASIEPGLLLLVIALAAGSVEAGVQYCSVFGPRKTGMEVEVFTDDTLGLLLHGRGVALVDDNGGGHRLIPVWWAFVMYAAAGAVLVKAPLLLIPVWLGGRAVVARTHGRSLGVAYLSAIVVGASIGVLIFAGYQSALHRHLTWRIWRIHPMPGFGGCLAGGACGTLVLIGRSRRAGSPSRLVEVALIDLILLATIGLVRSY